MKERIQEASKPDTPCSLFVGMVGREIDVRKNIIIFQMSPMETLD